jgi:hypothetical protein
MNRSTAANVPSTVLSRPPLRAKKNRQRPEPDPSRSVLSRAAASGCPAPRLCSRYSCCDRAAASPSLFGSLYALMTFPIAVIYTTRGSGFAVSGLGSVAFCIAWGSAFSFLVWLSYAASGEGVCFSFAVGLGEHRIGLVCKADSVAIVQTCIYCI